MGELPNPLKILDPAGYNSGLDEHEAMMIGGVGGANRKSKTWLAARESAVKPMPPKEDPSCAASKGMGHWMVVVYWGLGGWPMGDESLHVTVGY